MQNVSLNAPTPQDPTLTSSKARHQSHDGTIAAAETQPANSQNVDFSQRELSQRTRTETLDIECNVSKQNLNVSQDEAAVAQTSTKVKGESPTNKTCAESKNSFSLKKWRPKVIPQIPSTPSADQAARKFLLANGINLTLRPNERTLRKALLWAIVTKHSGAVRLLLNKGAYLEIDEFTQETALRKAINAGDAEILKVILHRKIDLEASDDEGWRPLHVAAAEGKADLIRILLEAGADSQAKTRNCKAAWDLALETRDVASLGILVEYGQDVNVANKDGLSAVHVAALKGDVPLLRFFLGVEANIFATTPDGMSPLDLALTSDSEGAIKVLLQNGAQVDGGKDRLPQMLASHNVDTMARLVMAQHVQNTAGRDAGLSVLHVAAQKGYADVVRLLLDNQYDVTISDKAGNTPLHLAASCGWEEVVKILLSRKANAMAKCTFGSTPLHRSARGGYTNTTNLLLTSLQRNGGQSLDVQDDMGRTPMYEAVMNGHTGVVQLFIDRHADHMIRDSYGVSAPTRADRNGHRKVLEQLRLYESKLQVTSYSQSHPRRLGTKTPWYRSQYEKETGMVDPQIIGWV